MSQKPYTDSVHITELERSLFLNMVEVHWNCRGWIWPEESTYGSGCCSSCVVQLENGTVKPLPVPKKHRYQVYFYRLRDGRIYQTTQGVWNMN